MMHRSHGRVLFIAIYCTVLLMTLTACRADEAVASSATSSAASVHSILPGLPSMSVAPSTMPTATPSASKTGTDTLPSASPKATASPTKEPAATVVATATPQAEQPKAEADGQSVTTQGIQYDFSGTDLTAVDHVDPSVAQNMDIDGWVSTSTGNTNTADGWYMVMTDITYTNQSASSQSVMLNDITVTTQDHQASFSLQYVEGIDKSDSMCFRVTLSAGESRSYHVGFVINRNELQDKDAVFKVDPDGLYDTTERTRFVDISIVYP